MGAIFGGVERIKKTLPKVGILSNGEERSKGTELTRTALEMVEKLPCMLGDDRVADLWDMSKEKKFLKEQSTLS